MRANNVTWPVWPEYDEAEMNSLLGDVLRSRRWTVRGWWTGVPTKDREFSEKFARYNGVNYCVTTSSGSTALALALEALDIGYGDEVIVPGLTWVAVPIAVLNVNAIPVLVDVDPETGCLSAEGISDAIGPKTRAIIVVHQHCRMADVETIHEIAKNNNLQLIEDCSQSHGAIFGGRKAGSFGDIGVFSMNQEKVLTCGEGGAVVTDSPHLYERLELLRADGCAYRPEIQNKYELQHLETDEGPMGGSHCLSEFQAAVLISQLSHLDEQNTKRYENALYLDGELEKLGLRPIASHPRLERPTYYEYAAFYDADSFNGKAIKDLCRCLTRALGFKVGQTDTPLYRNPLYRPSTKKRHMFQRSYRDQIDPREVVLPNAERFQQQAVVFHHRILLGSIQQMGQIVETFSRVLRN